MLPKFGTKLRSLRTTLKTPTHVRKCLFLKPEVKPSKIWVSKKQFKKMFDHLPGHPKDSKTPSCIKNNLLEVLLTSRQRESCRLSYNEKYCTTTTIYKEIVITSGWKSASAIELYSYRITYSLQTGHCVDFIRQNMNVNVNGPVVAEIINF